MTYKELKILAIGDGGLSVRCLKMLKAVCPSEIVLLCNNTEIIPEAYDAEISVRPLNREELTALTGQVFDYIFNIGSNEFYLLGLTFDLVENLGARALINFHDSMLPLYAGFYSTAWAILNGEKKHGITWHLWTEIIDSGPILASREVDIEDGETAASLNIKCLEAAIIAFPVVIECCKSGVFPAVAQTLEHRTFYDLWQRPVSHGVVQFCCDEVELDRIKRACDFGFADNRFLSVVESCAPELWQSRDANFTPEEQQHACINALEEVVKQEKFWVDQLVRPEAKILEVNPAEQFEQFVINGYFSIERTVAMISAALYRIWGLSQFSISVSTRKLQSSSAHARGMIADYFPLECVVSSDDTLETLEKSVGAVLKSLPRQIGFKQDVFCRYQRLKIHPQRYQVQIAEGEGTQGVGAALRFEIKEKQLDVLVSQSIPTARREAVSRFLQEFKNRANDIVPLAELGIKELSGEGKGLSWGKLKTYPENETLMSIIEQAMRSNPQRIALKDRQTEMSYYQLLERIVGASNGLRILGVTSGSRVVVDLARDIDLPIVYLAILRTGAVFVPLNNTDPVERKRRIIEIVAPELMIAADSCESIFTGEITTISDLTKLGASERRPVPQDFVHNSEDREAYILFTSGSTGNPKGVRIGHASLLNHMRWMVEEFGFSSHDQFLLKTPHTFDASVWELLAPFMVGATLNVASASCHLFGESLRDEVAFFKPTRLQLVPTQLRLMLEAESGEAFEAVRTLFLGGEAVTKGLLEKTRSFFSGEIVNLYGPTEATIDVTASRHLSPEQTPISIGRPIFNCGLAIIDSNNNLLPAGFRGEILIRGTPIALGYVGADEEQKDKFSPIGVVGDASARCYRTGDYGWRDDEGNFFYDGRIGSELKHRGYRIDRSEVESALTSLNGISAAACQIHLDSDGTSQLVGYLSHNRSLPLKKREVFKRLSELLPSYMLPDEIMFVPSFERLKSGKIDYSKLPVPPRTGQRATIEVPASEDLLETLLRLWRSVLKVEEVAPSDTFFGLGGNSLRLIELQTLIEYWLKKKVSLLDLFSHATPSAQLELFKNKAEKVAPRRKDRGSFQRQNSTRSAVNEPIAIIGINSVFPGSRNHHEFFSGILDKRDYVRECSHKARMLEKNVRPYHLDSEGVSEFDFPFFKVSPSELESDDPQHFVFLQNVWRALEDAGIAGPDFEDSIAVFGGCASNLNGRPSEGERMSHDWLISQSGWDKDHIATKTAFRLGLNGAAVNIQTACSTSLSLVHFACQSLLLNDCRVAVCASVSLCPEREQPYVFERGGIFSWDGHCRPFSAEATGTLFGNGAAAVVLKRLSEAQRDGDRVYAVIRATALNNDGANKQSYSAPSIAGQRAVIERAINKAQLAPDSIEYIECHGSGTELGDSVEIEALRQVFGEGRRLHLGSVKGNIGHLDSVAGLAGLIKTSLAIYNRKIPPTLSRDRLLPILTDEKTGFSVVREPTDWQSKETNLAGISSFGVGGTNAHCIIESAPRVLRNLDVNEKMPLIFTFSAENEERFSEVVELLRNWVQAYPSIAPQNLSYTLTCRTQHHAVRGFVIADSVNALFSALEEKKIIRGLDNAPIDTATTDGESNLGLIEKSLAAKVTGYADSLIQRGCQWCMGHKVKFGDLYPDGLVEKIDLPQYPLAKTRPWEKENRPILCKEDNGEVLSAPRGTSWMPVLREISFQEIQGAASTIKAKPLVGFFSNEISVDDFEFVKRLYPSGLFVDLSIQETPDHSAQASSHLIVVLSLSEMRGLEWDDFERKAVHFLNTLRTTFRGLDAQLENITLLVLGSKQLVNDSIVSVADGFAQGLIRTLQKEYQSLSVGFICCRDSASKQILLDSSASHGSLLSRYSEIYAADGCLARYEFLPCPAVNLSFLSSSDKPVLITGAFGALGPLLVRQLLGLGFSQFIFTTRGARQKPTGSWAQKLESRRQIEDMVKAEGASFTIIEADLERQEDVSNLVSRIKGENPSGLLGVIHLCRAHYDSLFEMADFEVAMKSCRPAIKGVCNLLKEISDAAVQVDFVNLFSSTISFTPLPGQLTYAITNCFLDQLAELRPYNLPITSVNWGLWKGTCHVDVAKSLEKDLYSIGYGCCDPSLATVHLLNAIGRDSRRTFFAPVYQSQIGAFEFGNDIIVPQNQSLIRPDVQTTVDQVMSMASAILGKKVSEIDLHVALTKYGLSSLSAIELKAKLKKKLGINIPLASFFAGISIADICEQSSDPSASTLPPSMEECISIRDSVVPLSDYQKGILFEAEMFPDDHSYTEIFAWQLEFVSSDLCLDARVRGLCVDHPGLNLFYSRAEKVLKRGDPHREWLQSLGTFKTDSQAHDELRARPITLKGEGMIPLSHFYRWQVEGDKRPRIAIVIHHLVTDLDSIKLIMADFCELNSDCSMPSTDGRFVDWQKQYLESADAQNATDHWRSYLQGFNIKTSFRPTSDMNLERRAAPSLIREIGLVADNAVRTLSGQLGLSIFQVLLANQFLMLHALTGNSDLIINVPMSACPQEVLEREIGFRVNSVPVRVILNGGMLLQDFFLEVRSSLLAAIEGRFVPFSKIVSATMNEHSGIENPFSDFAMVWQGAPLDFSGSFLRATSQGSIQSSAKFPINMMCYDTSQGIEGVWQYDSACYSKESVTFLADFLTEVIEASARMLPESLAFVRESLAASSIHASRGHLQPTTDEEKSLFDYLTGNFKRCLDHIAVAGEDGKLTYRELNARIESLAEAVIRSTGNESRAPIGIYLERSVELVPSMLALIKIGVPFVPLDRKQPKERMIEIARIAGAKFVLTKAALQPEVDFLTPICADAIPNLVDVVAGNVRKVDSDSDVYILFTSGSTGTPKGISITQSNLMTFFRGFDQYFPTVEDLHCAAVTTVTFDISILELLFPILRGGRVTICSSTVSTNPFKLSTFIAENKCNFVQMTPTAWQLMRLAEWKGNPSLFAVSGGEKIDKDLFNWLSHASRRAFNCYGPTETTIYATAFSSESIAQIVTVGTPLPGYLAAITGKDGGFQPRESKGELVLAGKGIARGYLNAPEKERECFFRLPNGMPAYRTGDLAKISLSGEIQIFERIDSQVKLNGYRIELEEIENCLAKILPTAKVVVVLMEDEQRKFLKAFIQPPPGIEVNENLHDRLRLLLPEYMIPAQFQLVSHFPVTLSGKVDRKALQKHRATDNVISPSSQQSLQYAACIEVIKGQSRGCPFNEDLPFMDLGFSSLKLAELQQSLNRELNLEISLIDFYRFGTPKLLLTSVLGSNSVTRKPITRGARRRAHFNHSSTDKSQGESHAQ